MYVLLIEIHFYESESNILDILASLFQNRLVLRNIYDKPVHCAADTDYCLTGVALLAVLTSTNMF